MHLGCRLSSETQNSHKLSCSNALLFLGHNQFRHNLYDFRLNSSDVFLSQKSCSHGGRAETQAAILYTLYWEKAPVDMHRIMLTLSSPALFMSGGNSSLAFHIGNSNEHCVWEPGHQFLHHRKRIFTLTKHLGLFHTGR